MLRRYKYIIKVKTKKLEFLKGKRKLKNNKVDLCLEIDIVCLQVEINILEVVIIDLENNKGDII